MESRQNLTSELEAMAQARMEKVLRRKERARKFREDHARRRAYAKAKLHEKRLAPPLDKD